MFIDNPEHTCELEKDFAVQRKASQHYKNVFVPQCDDVNKSMYKKMQKDDDTGKRWCVEPLSGKEVKGTRTDSGQPDPQCDTTSKLRYKLMTVDITSSLLT